MVDETLQLLHGALVLRGPCAAINDVLQRHQQPEHVPFAPPERPVAALCRRDAWQALPQHPLGQPA